MTGPQNRSEMVTRRTQREAGPAFPQRTLVVLIPCLDEERTVGRVIAEIPREIPGFSRVIPLVVDDGSTDDTALVARQAGAEVIRHRRNQGLGRTFRAGVHRALELGVDVMVNIDGDGQFDPRQIPRLVEPILDGRAEMVTASRFRRSELIPDMPRVKLAGNRLVAWVVWLLTGQRFADVSCGFRAFSRRALLSMNLFGNFTYTQETFLDLVYKDFSILEVPMAVRGRREHGSSRVASNLVRYAYRSLQIMLRAFVSYRPFTFFSALSAVFSLVGFGFLAFLLFHYVENGRFSPHIWAGFVGASFTFLGIVVLIMGVMADMMVRLRANQEQILYHLRQDRIDPYPGPGPLPGPIAEDRSGEVGKRGSGVPETRSDGGTRAVKVVEPTEGSAQESPGTAGGVRRVHLLWALVVLCLALVAIKTVLAEQVLASALFADDYLYLQIGGLLASGEVEAAKQEVRAGAGLVYPLVISGWTGVDDLGDRFRYVFLVNTLLHAAFLFLVADALSKLTRGDPLVLAVAVCLATLPSVFVLGYYVLAENLLFPLLALVVWLLVDGEKAFRGWRFATLAGVVALGPLVRPPGLAISLGVLAALVPYVGRLGRLAAVGRAATVTLAALVPYLTLAAWLGGGREGRYLHRIELTLFDLGKWYTPFTLSAGQIPYLLFAAGLWAIPLLVFLFDRAVLRRRSEEGWRAVRSMTWFVMVASGGFTGFAVIHLLSRQATRADGAFYFIGRYLDPAAVLLAIGGGAGILLVRRVGWVGASIGAGAATAALFGIYVLFSDQVFRPSIQTGLSIFSNSDLPVGIILLGVLLTGLPWLWFRGRGRRRVAALLLLAGWLGYNMMSLGPSMAYTVGRATKVRQSLEAAAWLSQNGSPGSLVCLDQGLRDHPVPGGVKTMGHLFLAMEFAAFPLRVEPVEQGVIEGCQFYFSLAREATEDGARPGTSRAALLRRVWSRGAYEVYRVDGGGPPSAGGAEPRTE